MHIRSDDPSDTLVDAGEASEASEQAVTHPNASRAHDTIAPTPATTDEPAPAVQAAANSNVSGASDPETRLYMACIDLRGRSCLVVGGGRVGHEKAAGLLDCGATVTVVAPSIEPDLAALPVAFVERPYRAEDLDGHFLVIAATPDADVNTAVYNDAERTSTLCNVSDVPHLCSFILPAIHRQGPITVAVSTGGASPALAQRLRSDIADRVGPEYAELARRLLALRPWAKERYPTYAERRDFFQRLVERSLQ